MLILIIGSAPDALEARTLNRELFGAIVTINNAWNIRNDWDFCIFPDDFPESRRPKKHKYKRLINSTQYVPIQNNYGGFVYSGGTMSFTAGYWALGYFKPKAIAYIGCDMIYDGKDTHFYGRGKPDPLRKDPTLKNLRAKSARLEAIASSQGCSIFNLSKKPTSNLVFRRSKLETIVKEGTPREIKSKLFEKALEWEERLGYFVENGKYWKHLTEFDQKKIDVLDSLWNRVIGLD